MPFTPFHLGPALLLGALFPRRLDPPTLLAASVLVDVRAALVVYGPLGGPVHGVLTTFLGGAAVALLVAAATTSLPRSVQTLLDHVRLRAIFGWRPVVAAAFVGVYSHVVLDSVLYADARPFFPLDRNPLLVGDPAVLPAYGGCVLAGLVGLGLFAVRWSGTRPTDSSE